MRAGHANVPDWKRPERLVLLNKVDRLRDNRELPVWQQKIPQSLPISALSSTEDNRAGAGRAHPPRA